MSLGSLAKSRRNTVTASVGHNMLRRRRHADGAVRFVAVTAARSAFAARFDLSRSVAAISDAGYSGDISRSLSRRRRVGASSLAATAPCHVGASHA